MEIVSLNQYFGFSLFSHCDDVSIMSSAWQWLCECADVISAGHYSAILRRNPSTSSRTFREKNLGNSVDDGVRDNGGMCRKAFLGGEQDTKKTLRTQVLDKSLHLELKHNLTVCSEGQCERVQGWSPWMQWPKRWGETGTRWPKHPKQTPLYSW